jgi:DNA-3-methyladenine glycosylase II
MADIVARVGACEMGGRDPGFESLANVIIAQQLSRKAATTIRNRVVDALGGQLAPEPLLAHDLEALRICGLSRPKIAYLKAMAARVLDGSLDFAALDHMEDEAGIELLTSLKGIGRWSAEMYLMFVVGHPDLLPLDDAALKTTFWQLYDVPRDQYREAFVAAGERWRPFRSAACWYFYAHANGQGTVLEEKA